VKELADEYRKSVQALNKRINELENLKEFLIRRTKDPDLIELNERLKLLKIMQRETMEVAKEIEHYYDRSWWRSEKYTLNRRKSRKFIYSEPIYYEDFDEYEGTGEDEKISFYSNGFSIITTPETSYGNVLYRREKNAGNS